MKITGAAALLALLAGCGGGGDSSSSSEMGTPAAMAKVLGCDSSFKVDTTDEIGVREVGKCDVEGQEVRLLTFGGTEAREQYVKVANEFGGIYVNAETWAVEVPSTDLADKVKEKVGGDIS